MEVQTAARPFQSHVREGAVAPVAVQGHRGFLDFCKSFGDFHQVFFVDNLGIVFRAEYADLGDLSFAYLHALMIRGVVRGLL